VVSEEMTCAAMAFTSIILVAGGMNTNNHHDVAAQDAADIAAMWGWQMRFGDARIRHHADDVGSRSR